VQDDSNWKLSIVLLASVWRLLSSAVNPILY
jgi:hypothetical protein